MTILDSLKEWFATCPLLADNSISVDYLDKDVDTSINLDTVPTNPIIQKFVDGGSKRQFTFVLASCEPWGNDVIQNLENNGFYEELQKWIESNTDLPVLDQDKKALYVEALTYGYLMSNDSDRAYYQIQLRLVYFQERMCK